MTVLDSHFFHYAGPGKGPLPPIEPVSRVRDPRTQYPSGMANESFEDVLKAELERQGLVPAETAVQPGETPDALAERLQLDPAVAGTIAQVHAAVMRDFSADPDAARARYLLSQKPAPPSAGGTLDVEA